MAKVFLLRIKKPTKLLLTEKKEIILRNLKLTVAIAAVVAALSACGGGGGNDNGGVDTSAMTLSVNPSTDQNLPANTSLKLNMAASVRRVGTSDTNSVKTMSWAVTPLGGETKSPTLSNAACAGASISGAQAGCDTLLSIPADVTTGRFNVIATATASNGTQRSQSFVVNVNNTVYTITAGNAQTTEQQKNGAFNVVTLTGNLSGQNGPKIVSINWEQLDGPAKVQLANDQTFTPTFVPTALGKYTFQLTVVADDKTFTAQTTVDAQLSSN